PPRKPYRADMAIRTATDPRAWRADTIDRPDCWSYPLSAPAVSALERAARDWQPNSTPVTDLRASDELRATCTADGKRIRTALEDGCGFAVVTAGPPGHFGPRGVPGGYWLRGPNPRPPVPPEARGDPPLHPRRPRHDGPAR